MLCMCVTVCVVCRACYYLFGVCQTKDKVLKSIGIAHPRATAGDTARAESREASPDPRPDGTADTARKNGTGRMTGRSSKALPRSDVHIHMNLGGHERVHEHREDGARQAGLHPTVCDAQPRAFKYVSKVGVRARDRRVRAVDVESIRRA